MANPFANAPHFTSELNGAYLFGIQTGQKTYEQGGVDQMKYITLNQLTAFVRGTFGNLWNYRGEYSSALPTNHAVNDYFLATGTFTVDGVTFTSGHMYAYNGLAWSDITNVLAQYATAEEVTGINDRLEIAESRITALSGGIVPKGECTEAELPNPPSSSNVGWLYFVTDLGKYQVSDGTQWIDFGNYPIQTFALRSSFPATGAERTLYVAYDEAKVYWWNGSAYVSEIDDLEKIKENYTEAVRITAQNTTLNDIRLLLNTINSNGRHVLFDVSALGANAYLCTIFMDSTDEPNIVKIFDLVKGRIYQTGYNATITLAQVLASAYDVATRSEIDNLQDQINKMKQGEVGDDVVFKYVKALTVTSTSGHLTFTIVDEGAFIDAIHNCDEGEYLLVYNGTAWTYNGVVVTDFGITVTGTPTTGEVMHVQLTNWEELYTIVDDTPTGDNATKPVDTTISKFYIAEKKYVENNKRQSGADTAMTFNFDAPESAICVTEGYTLPAGKYYIYNIADATGDYWCNYKRLYYTFEILHDIVATAQTGDIQLRYYNRGDRETTGDARGIYQLYCKPTKCIDDTLYNSDTIAFVGQVAQPSSEYTDIRTIEHFNTVQTMDENGVGIVYNNLGHVCYGNNQWDVSNLCQRINSSEKAMHPVRMHRNDIVTGLKNVKGGMWGLDPRIKALITPAVVSQVYGVSDEHTKNTLYTAQNTAFLLSMVEMSFDIQTTEGVVTKLYSDWCGNALVNTAVAPRGKADKAGVAPALYRWARSSGSGSSSTSRLVPAGGSGTTSGAVDGHRFAPAYILKSLI